MQLLHATNPDLLEEIRHPLDLVSRVERFSGGGVPIGDLDVTLARPSAQRVQRPAALAGRITRRDEGPRCANRFFGHFFAHTSYHLSVHSGILPEIQHLVRQQEPSELKRWRRDLITNPPAAWRRKRIGSAAAILGVVADHDHEGLGAVFRSLKLERPDLADALLWHLAAPGAFLGWEIDGRMRREDASRFRKLIALSPTYPPSANLIRQESIAQVTLGPLHTQRQLEFVLRELPRPAQAPSLKATVVRESGWMIVAEFRWGADINPRVLVREAWKDIALVQEQLRFAIGRRTRGKRRRRSINPVTQWVARHLCGETYLQIAGGHRSWQPVQRAVIQFWSNHGLPRRGGPGSYIWLRKNVRTIARDRGSSSPR
jgi:hypothetical protein